MRCSRAKTATLPLAPLCQWKDSLTEIESIILHFLQRASSTRTKWSLACYCKESLHRGCNVGRGARSLGAILAFSLTLDDVRGNALWPMDAWANCSLGKVGIVTIADLAGRMSDLTH